MKKKAEDRKLLIFFIIITAILVVLEFKFMRGDFAEYATSVFWRQ